MKKSQLRKIIRESIKQLLTEQSPPMGKICSITRCNGGGSGWGGICIPNSIPNAVGDGVILDYLQNPAAAVQATGFNNTVDQMNLNGIPWFIVSSGAPCVATINGVPIQVSPYTSFGDIYGNNALSTQGCWWCCSNNGYPGVCGNACTSNTACTNPNAWNYNPNATVDDGSCEYGYVCKSGWKPGVPGKCIPGDSNTTGPVGPSATNRFPSEQACLASGCEPLPADQDLEKDITPFTTTPQSMVKPEDDLVVIWPSKSEDLEIDPIGPAGPVAPPVQSKITGGEMRCCGNGHCDVGCTGDLCDTVGGKWTCLAPPEDDEIRRMQELAFKGKINEQAVNPCDWNNFPIWRDNWTNNNAFQNLNNNPNQPCNHICNQLHTWDTNLNNAVPFGQQAMQLNCKIMEGTNQANIHGCPC